MFILVNIINAIAYVMGMALDLYTYIIIIRALISWVNPDPNNPIIIFLYKVTEPVMARVRRIIPMHKIGIDISPIIIIFAIYFLKIAVVGSLVQLAQRMR